MWGNQERQLKRKSYRSSIQHVDFPSCRSFRSISFSQNSILFQRYNRTSTQLHLSSIHVNVPILIKGVNTAASSFYTCSRFPNAIGRLYSCTTVLYMFMLPHCYTTSTQLHHSSIHVHVSPLLYDVHTAASQFYTCSCFPIAIRRPHSRITVLHMFMLPHCYTTSTQPHHSSTHVHVSPLLYDVHTAASQFYTCSCFPIAIRRPHSCTTVLYMFMFPRC